MRLMWWWKLWGWKLLEWKSWGWKLRWGPSWWCRSWWRKKGLQILCWCGDENGDDGYDDYGWGINCSVCLTEIAFSVNQTELVISFMLTMMTSRMVIMMATMMMLQTENCTNLLPILSNHWIFAVHLMNRNKVMNIFHKFPLTKFGAFTVINIFYHDPCHHHHQGWFPEHNKMKLWALSVRGGGKQTYFWGLFLLTSHPLCLQLDRWW